MTKTHGSSWSPKYGLTSRNPRKLEFSEDRTNAHPPNPKIIRRSLDPDFKNRHPNKPSQSPNPTSISEMAPKPYDDLFIEPPGDYDVVYGDYNSTMDDGTGRRPYLRLTSNLPNVTRHVGGEVRLKCEAAGSPLPITFTWLKNHAPVEKNRRTKVRNRDYWSKLVITDLDVLDSGYYQCTASNSAGSVNTTSVLRVNNTPNPNVKTKPTTKVNKQKNSRISDEYDDNDYEHYFDEQSMDRGRLPVEEDEFLHVPSNAAGTGYVPLGPTGMSDRWLDGKTLRAGECMLYQGDACRSFLSGKHIMITSENREDMYDIDRQLRAAMMFIQNMPNVSSECKRYSHAIACYHMYKVCDKTPVSSSPNNKVISLCRKDCDNLKDKVCPAELALAAQHELVGDGPKALIPRCESLNPDAERCIRVLEPVQPPPPMNTPIDKNDANAHQQEHMTHWCYVNSGKNYGGSIKASQSGRQCINWSQSTSSQFNTVNYPNLQTSKNYCRNPGGLRPAPWCYTQPHGGEELCDVPKCPDGMYPHLREKPETEQRGNTGISDGDSLGDSMNDVWKSLSSQWQFTAMAGIGALAVLLLILLICCACCCRKKKRKHGSETMQSSSTKKTTYPPHSCNGSSVVNSAANSAYYRKVMNGNLPPGRHFGGSYEMNALLPQNGPNPPYMGSLPYLQQQQTQYSPQTSTEPPVEPYHIPHIQPQQLKIDRLVGDGQFGVVYCAEWIGGFMGGGTMQVAIKSLKPGSSRIERENFEEEIKAVASFEHPNVIRLLGVSYLDSQQVSAVFEYMVHGDLHEFLKVREPRGNDDENATERYRNFDDFVRIATQIAYGMEYLSSMNYVHRDLAARNCLVGDQQVIKIADFGSLRSCYESDYYMTSHRAKMPIRWMSKEAVNEQRFSQSSDVWSFGVTLWEMYTFGRKPYEGFSNPEVINMINNRHLLECPPSCPPNIYGIMVECWHENPERRPTFSELHSRFQKWCLSGPTQYIMPHQNRASSTHSAGSSGGHRGSRQSSSNPSASLMRGAGLSDQFGVPSPAPNSQQGTITKLTMLNNGSSIVHSTPIGQPSYANTNNRSPKSRGTGDGSPLMKRPGRGNYMYSDEDDSSEED